MLVVVWLAGLLVFPQDSKAGVMPAALRAADSPDSVTPGLNYDYYEGTWTALPDFTGLAARKLGSVVNVDLGPRVRENNYAFRFTGFIDVPADGVYTFYTTSDDGSRLQIGDAVVVNNDGEHDAKEESGTIGLKAGKHAITITYFSHLGASVLITSYAGPGIAKQLIPAAAFYRTGDPIASWRLEAEYAVLSGPAAGADYGGYTGSGYAVYPHASDDYITWFGTTPQPGIYQLTFRYALAAEAVDMTLEINTAYDTTIHFEPTSSWSSWSVLTFKGVLNEASNTIRLIAAGAGGPHIDHLILGYPGVTTVVVSTGDAVIPEAGGNTMIPYPNPSSGSFHIDLQVQDAKPVEIDLVNATGAIVKSETFTGLQQGSNTLTLNTEGMRAGIYWMRVKQGNRQKAASVVIR